MIYQKIDRSATCHRVTGPVPLVKMPVVDGCGGHWVMVSMHQCVMMVAHWAGPAGYRWCDCDWPWPFGPPIHAIAALFSMNRRYCLVMGPALVDQQLIWRGEMGEWPQWWRQGVWIVGTGPLSEQCFVVFWTPVISSRTTGKGGRIDAKKRLIFV